MTDALLRDCPYCRRVDAVADPRDPEIVVCPDCGFYRLRERLAPAAQRRFLQDYNDGIKLEEIPSPSTWTARCRGEIAQLRRSCPGVFPGGRVLDVGSGTGYFLSALREAGARPSGIEPAARLVGMVRAAGLDARQGFFEPGNMGGLDQERFDLVAARECVYYFADLKAFFATLRGILRPTGYFYLRSHQPKSCFYWGRPRGRLERYGRYVQGMATPAAMKGMLEREGFEVVAFDYFPHRVLYFCGVDSPVVKPVDVVLSWALRPILKRLAALNWFWMVARPAPGEKRGPAA